MIVTITITNSICVFNRAVRIPCIEVYTVTSYRRGAKERMDDKMNIKVSEWKEEDARETITGTIMYQTRCTTKRPICHLVDEYSHR